MKTLDIGHGGIAEATLSRQSFATSELQFSRPCASLDEAAPYTVGEEYQVSHDGRAIIVGPVTQCERRLSGSSGYYWSVVISDRWWYLENCLYLSLAKRLNVYAPGSVIKAGPWGGDSLRDTMPMADALDMILANNAKFAEGDWRLDIDSAAEIIPFCADVAKHADLLRACQKWRPTLASYFDYADPSSPVLVITDEGAAVTVDREDLLTDVVLRPRPDLIPPAVGVIGTGNSSANAKVVAKAVYPEGADELLKEPYALTVTVNLPPETLSESGDPTTDDPEQAMAAVAAHTAAAFAPRMIVRGKAFPPDDMIGWWRDHLPLLAKVPAKDLAVTDEAVVTAVDSSAKDVGGYAGVVLTHEFVSGQHNGNKRIQWSEVKVVQKVLYNGTPPATIAGYFPVRNDDGYYEGEFSATFYMIDTHYYSYALDGNNTPLGGEGEPDPPLDDYEDPAPQKTAAPHYGEICRTAWEAAQKLEYEGTITLIGGPPIETGMRLNLTGTAAEYAGMLATVQTVSTDLTTGVRTVTVGPAEQIGIQTMIERARSLCKQSQDATPISDDVEDLDRPDGSTSATMPDDPRPDAPMLSPKWEFNVGAGLADTTAGFTVRAIKDDSGKVKYQYQQGLVLGPVDKKTVGSAGWNDLAITSGAIYCNITLDYEGKITDAVISGSETSQDRPKVYAYGRRGINGEEYRPGKGDPFNPEGSTYSIQIADIDNQVVTMHHLGVITLPLLPQYVIYQLDDYTANPNADKTNADASAQSLIATNEDTHAYLRKIAAGEGIKFGKRDDDDTEPPSGEIRINATALPSHYFSESTGFDLFEEKVITPIGESEAIKAYLFRNLRAMSIQETRAYADELGVSGAPCRVILRLNYDASQSVNEILIGALFNTFADGL